MSRNTRVLVVFVSLAALATGVITIRNYKRSHNK